MRHLMILLSILDFAASRSYAANLPIAPFDINAGHTYSLGPPVPFTTTLQHVEVFTSPTATGQPGLFTFDKQTAANPAGSFQIDFPALATRLQLACELGGRATLKLTTGLTDPAGPGSTQEVFTGAGNVFTVETPDLPAPRGVSLVLQIVESYGQPLSLINCHVVQHQ